MRTRIPGIIRAIDGMPWAIVPAKLRAIVDVLELRAAGKDARPEGFKAAEVTPARRLAEGKVAVIPLHGVICQRMGMVSEMSGGTSCEGFGKVYEAAMKDPSVSTVVLDVDSPGGSVNGVPELAAKMFGLKGKKRVIAVANTLCASAAYWIASVADEFVASPSAEVGSIGVFTVHVDESRANEAMGLDVTVVKAGQYKGEDLPFQPLTAEGKEALQSDVDDLYAMFTGDVAKHRRAALAKVQGASYGEGRVLSAKKALRGGMVDRIASLDDVLKSLGAETTKAGVRAAPGVASAMVVPPLERAALAGLTAGMPGRIVVASTVNHTDDTSKGPYNDESRDPLHDAPSTTPQQDDYMRDDDEYEPGACDACNGAMDPNGVCSNCGWVDPEGPSADGEAEGSGTRQELDDESRPNSEPVGKAGGPLRDPSDRSPDGATNRGTGRTAQRTKPTPAKQAPKAEGATMPAANGTAPEIGADNEGRFLAISVLAKEHGKGLDDVTRWVKDGTSVEGVRTEILAGYKAGARALPGIGSMTDRMDGHEFSSFGAQLSAIVRHGSGRVAVSNEDMERLRHVNARARQFFAGTPSGMSEGIPTDGGFFIQPELLPGVIDPVYKEDPLLSRVTRIPIAANTNGVRYNVVDEISRTTGNRWGALQMYWLSEADTATPSKPRLRLFELNLKKLIGISYLTDELIQNAPAAESLLTRAFVAETQFMITAAIFNGTGGGQPQGFLNSASLVTQAIEGSETKANQAQYLGLNLTKMMTSIPSSLWGDLIWVYNQELLPYLMNATIGSTGTAVPIFVPLGGFVNRPFDMILGRPAFPSEFCQAPGTPGDIIAIVPSQYHIGEQGGLTQAWSIHVQFLTDQTALRITQRLDGAPLWRTSVTPYLGAVQRSPFVQLATRT